MLNFSPKGAIVPMAHKGNTALEQPGYHPADTFPAAQFKKPRKMPPPPAPAGVNLNMPRTLPKPPMQAPMGTADSGTHKHIPGGPAATPSLTDPVTDPVPQIPVQNNAPPAEFDPSARPVEIEGGNALAPSMIPVGGNPRAPPMIPAAGNPLATPVIPTAEKPLAPPVIPATETTLTPPVIPAAGNQLAPPVIPAAENPLAPPVIPAASNAVATPTTPPPGNPLPPPVAMPAMNALTTPVIPADTSVDSQAEQKPPTVQAPSPPAAVPEEVAITMEGENIPPKPIVPKALSIDFPAGLEAFSPRIFDSTPTPVPDSKLQMSEQKMPAADTPNFEFPNSPGTGNFTPGPFEPFSFDVTAEAFALAGSASTPRDSEDDFGLKSCTPLLDNPPSSNNASN